MKDNTTTNILHNTQSELKEFVQKAKKEMENSASLFTHTPLTKTKSKCRNSTIDHSNTVVNNKHISSNNFDLHCMKKKINKNVHTKKRKCKIHRNKLKIPVNF